jgi:hypothetical protein
MFVADVGQDRFEEIDIVQKGGNYGWNIMEGLHCFNPPTACPMSGLSLPIVEISHPEAEAVIGGFVYHGTAVAGMQGRYIFGDLSGNLSLTKAPPGPSRPAFGHWLQYQLFRAGCGGRALRGGYLRRKNPQNHSSVKPR